MQTAQEVVAAINALPIAGAYGKDRMLISATVDHVRGRRAVQGVTLQWCYVHRLNDVSRVTVNAQRGRVSPDALVSAINHSAVKARVRVALGDRFGCLAAKGLDL